MPAPSFSVDDIPMEEFHGELLHYSRPASLQSQANSPTETPLRWICHFLFLNITRDQTRVATAFVPS